MLILKRASKSRPGGEWSDDDYDVFDGDQHIGRIMWTHAAPEERVSDSISIARMTAQAVLADCDPSQALHNGKPPLKPNASKMAFPPD